MTEFISNREIYEKVICGGAMKAKKRLWLATADLKDMYIDSPAGMVSFLEVLAGMLERGIEVRLIHAKEPGPNFREDFDRFPILWEGLERVLCPRVHFKCVIVDGLKAYFGSANMTGAGMGAKSENKRNFENGIWTDAPSLIEPLSEQFDALWRGDSCKSCNRRQFCTDGPIA